MLSRNSIGAVTAVICAASLLMLSACGGNENPSSPAAAGTPAAETKVGETVYNRSCVACHLSGVSGAPRIGDKVAWGERAQKGLSAMIDKVVEGIPPAMPPMGLCNTCSESDLQAATEYMMNPGS